MLIHFTSTIWWKAKTANRPPVGFCLPILICRIQGHRALEARFLAERGNQIRSTLPTTSATKTTSKKWFDNFEAKMWRLIPIEEINIFRFPVFLAFFCINRSFTRQAVGYNLPRCLAKLFVMCASKISKMVIWKLTWKESIFKIRIKHISVTFARSPFIMRSISFPIQECMMKEGNTVKYVRSLLNGRFRRVTSLSMVAQLIKLLNAIFVQNLSQIKVTWEVMSTKFIKLTRLCSVPSVQKHLRRKKVLSFMF